MRSVTTPWLDEEEHRAWRAWLDLNAKMAARINRELQADSGLSLSDYEILVALTDADVPDHTLRMYELGERLHWEKSRVSKQVSRMAARGLLVRRECADDRRGAFVELTDAGRAAIEGAAPGHVELVHTIFFDGLSREELATLTKVTLEALARLER